MKKQNVSKLTKSLLVSGKVRIKKSIMETTDLSIFNLMPEGNREIVDSHVKELEKRFKRNQLDVVIQVNEKLEIIEGQHRYTALKKINEERIEKGEILVPIQYFESEGYGPDECMEYNGKGKNWDNNDISKSKSITGNVNYIIYRQFLSDYSLPHNVVLGILTGKVSASKSDRSYKNGEFKVTIPLDDAKRIAKMIREVAETGVFSISGTNTPLAVYCLALLKIFKLKNYDHNLMVSKAKGYSDTKGMLESLGNITDCVVMLEMVYNTNRKKIVSFLTEKEKNKLIMNNLRTQKFK